MEKLKSDINMMRGNIKFCTLTFIFSSEKIVLFKLTCKQGIKPRQSGAHQTQIMMIEIQIIQK